MVYLSSMTVESVELLARIIKTICAEFDITIDQISKNQKVNRYASKETVLISYARTIAMSLLSKHFKLREVASLLNCTDHSTVIYAKRRLSLLLEVNPLVREKLNNIEKQLNK
jgi:chromosomal replication initiation ATPase DnaA